MTVLETQFNCPTKHHNKWPAQLQRAWGDWCNSLPVGSYNGMTRWTRIYKFRAWLFAQRLLHTTATSNLGWPLRIAELQEIIDKSLGTK